MFQARVCTSTRTGTECSFQAFFPLVHSLIMPMQERMKAHDNSMTNIPGSIAFQDGKY